jgi:photosystem II stability/assembly factor-like uncharacterized protein
MYKISLYLIFCLFLFSPTLFPQIDSIFNRISTDSLIYSVKELTGAEQVFVNGKVDTIKTRYYLTTYNRLATQFISEKMERTELNASVNHFHGKQHGFGVEFTDIAFSNGDQFPLFLCTDWGEIFVADDFQSAIISLTASALPDVNRLDWIKTSSDSKIFAAGKNGYFIKSIDNGLTWSKINTGLNHLTDLLIVENNLILIDKTGKIWSSIDEGESWTEISVISGAELRTGTNAGNNIILIGGKDLQTGDGIMYKSEDLGLTWNEVNYTFETPLTSIFAYNDSYIWITGDSNYIHYTHTGIDSLITTTYSDNDSTAKQIFFSNISNGWIIGDTSKIYHSSNGGENWSLISEIDTPSVVNDVLFIDNNNGILIGDDYTNVVTLDGGSTWVDYTIPLPAYVIAELPGTTHPDKVIIVSAHLDNQLYDDGKYFLSYGADDDASGVAVLFELARFFKDHPIPYTLKFIAIPDEEVGGYGAYFVADKILSLSDTIKLCIDFDMVGYDSISPNSLTMSYLEDSSTNDIYYSLEDKLQDLQIPITLNRLIGVTVPDLTFFYHNGFPVFGFHEWELGGLINPNYHKITDTWSSLNYDYLTNVTKTAAVLIHFFANETLVSVKYEPDIPSKYFISQNYPNPFNPTTTIKYQIPELSFVTIKVYDVLGNEIATLVNEEKQTGSYEITWYAEDLTSGVYFYRLQAGSFVEIKKMVLMK